MFPSFSYCNGFFGMQGVRGGKYDRINPWVGKNRVEILHQIHLVKLCKFLSRFRGRTRNSTDKAKLLAIARYGFNKRLSPPS